MNREQIRLRKILVLGGIAFLMLAVGLIIWAYLQSQKNQFGDELQISNLSQYTREDPTSLDSIRHSLFAIVNLNRDTPVKNNSIKDIVVRENTFKREQNPKTQVITISFIVDIASLKQSYSVQYQWHPTKKWTEDLDEYGTYVTCLPVEKLTYGDFSCKDFSTEARGPSDKLLSQLPHETDQYAITLKQGVKTLGLTIWTTPEDERTGSKAAVDRYEAQALDWIEAQGEDSDDWTIEYNIIRASM